SRVPLVDAMALINSWQFIASLASPRTRAAASRALTFLGFFSAGLVARAFAGDSFAGSSGVGFFAASAFVLVVFFEDISFSLDAGVLAAAPRLATQRDQNRSLCRPTS